LYVADSIKVRDEAVVAATRERSHYREYLGRIITVDEAATQRSHYDSSLEEVVKHRRREDVASFREQNCPRRERRALAEPACAPTTPSAPQVTLTANSRSRDCE
jgi:hypothetical protein